MPKTPIPQDQHLADWPNPEAATAKDAVRGLMEHPGWKHLIASRDELLAHEQLLALSSSRSIEHVDHERRIGRWAGLSLIEGIALGVIKRGEEAEAALRQ